MHTIGCYLELEEKLHNDSFDVELDVPEELYPYQIIGMILQPLIENAILHGIDKLRGGRGEIRIVGRHEDDLILFTVADNGPGMTEEKFRECVSVSSHGYGLKNVNDRLTIAYGPEHTLVLLPSEKGTTIQIRIPARTVSTA